jgi:apolipoprotein N-acyltransferase
MKRAIIMGLIAFIAGGILPLAFAPIHWFPLAIISPAILLYIFQQSTAKQAFYRGWFFGLGFFGVGASWVYVSIHHFGNANAVLAGFITLVFVMYLALFPAAVGYFFRLIFRNKQYILTTLFAFPALWVISEWLRGWLFTGFPWLFLGDSQVNTWLHGFAAIIGVYGISLLVTFISGCLVLLVFHKSWRIKIMCLIFILASYSIGALLSMIHWNKPADNALQVSLVQGNVSQTIKWSPEHLFHIMQIYKNETETHFSSNIIVWPEAAIPNFLQQITFYFQQMDQAAKQHHVAIITGVPIYNADTQQSFNGMMVLGNGHGTYLKRQLVPFGEYIPLKPFYGHFMQYFDIPMSDLSRGPIQQPAMLADNHTFAGFICYEIAYPQLVLNSMNNMQFIVVVSDDSWFGKSMASAQQLQMAQMRALETGRYILYSTNTGITAIINPQGQIQQMLAQDTQAVLTGKIVPITGKTLLMWWNYYPLLVLIIFFLIIAFIF